MTRATDEDGGGIMPEPTLGDDDLIIEAITETLREPGARLCDFQFFEKFVGPLYDAYGDAAVDTALRQLHADARRRAASEISQLRFNAGRVKREQRTT